MIRLAFAQTYPMEYGDSLHTLVESGPLDYLLLHCSREGGALIESMSRQLRDRGVRLLCSLTGCAPRQVAAQISQLSGGLKISTVSGNGLDQDAGHLADRGVALPGTVISIAAPLGAFPLAEAFNAGADIVLAGECPPASLALAAALHHFNLAKSDLASIAGASLAGRILGAGPTACGGSTQADWETLFDPASIDAPLAEIEADGSCVITKHPGSGGAVNCANVIEALLHGVGDPRTVHTPDCLLDLTGVEAIACGPDRVRVRGAKGAAPQAAFAAVQYRAGWRAAGEVLYTRPAALEKAYAADRILREKSARLGLRLDEIHSDFTGAGSSLIPAAVLDAAASEVMLRVAALGQYRADVERFARLIALVAACGPPGGFVPGAAEPRIEELIAARQVAIPPDLLRPQVEVIA